VLAFCGIARPERFRKLLAHAGIKPLQFIPFPDHFSYPSESLKQIVELFNAQKADVCITTEKDSIKIKDNPTLQNIPVYYLKIGIQTDEEFLTRVFSTLKRRGLLDV